MGYGNGGNMARICPYCGATNKDIAELCRKCERPISPITQGPFQPQYQTQYSPQQYPPYPQPYQIIPPGKEDKSILLIVSIVIFAVVIIFAIAIAAFLTFQFEIASQEEEDISLRVTSAEWRDYDLYGFHGDANHRFLWLTLEITNNDTKTITLSSYGFECNNSDGSSYGSIIIDGLFGVHEVAPGNSANVTVIFMVPNDWTPEIVTYQDWMWIDSPWENEPKYSTDVPTPTQGESHMLMMITNATLNSFDLNYSPVSEGKICLWLEVEINNNWNDYLPLSSIEFDIEGENGTIYAYPDFDGPDFILSGGSATITLVFEIPEDIIPLKLHYYPEFGPLSHIDIPTPT